MKQTYLIKRAILSEKTYKQMEKGLYTFLVDERATKNEIAKYVQKHFQVKVKKVNVLTKPQKTKRIARARKYTKTQGGKKAAVYLEEGQSIALLSPKTKKSKETKTEEKDTKGKGLLNKLKRPKEEKKEEN